MMYNFTKEIGKVNDKLELGESGVVTQPEIFFFFLGSLTN